MTNDAGKSLAVLMAMAIQQFNTMCIAGWSTSRATLEATRYRHQASACVVLPWRLPWSTISTANTKTLPKH
jgi:hypothetical protein